MTLSATLVAVLGLHALAALVAGPVAARIGRRVLLVVAAAPAALLVWSFAAVPDATDGTPIRGTLSWAPSLGFDLSVAVDGFSLLMLALVAGIGILVFVYSSAYFEDRPDIGRIAGLLVAFGGAMAGLVVVDNLLAVFLFWEATSVTSFLLIGTDDRSGTARAAAVRALLTTGVGGLAMLGGFVLLAQQAGTWSLSALVANPPSGTVVEVAVVLVLLGAFTKSAQFPFHYWLPGAMAAPTPISAYLHSATMVKAGVYLIARLAPGFADFAVWRPLVVTAGLVTMLVGGWRALSQTDLKLLLAHGTTSQLGFLVVLFGMGYADVALGAAAMLLAHGLFKCVLFMVVGIVDHQAHTRDLRRLRYLHLTMPRTTWMAAIGAASMAGLPPLFGFVAKEASLEGLLHISEGFGPWVVAGVALGSVLTFAYSARFLWGMVGPDVPGVAPAKGEVQRPIDPGWWLLAPPAVLVVLTVAGGVTPATLSGLVVRGARALHASLPEEPLALWHGFTAALAISAAIVAAGAGLFYARAVVARLRRRLPRIPSGGRVFDIGLDRLLRGSDVLIGHVQTGSLPMYLVVILSTALLLPALLLGIGGVQRPDAVLVDDPGQLVTVALIALVSVGAVVLRPRLAAVLCVSGAGYGVAVLFMYQGAPDLALTQVLVETLLMVIFVLVLRHLPRRFAPNQTAMPVLPRAALSLVVGAFAATFVLIAFSSRPDVAPVSEEYLAASPEAGGANVVNAILVEFRSFDTMGETAVLTVAALGVLGLVRAARRSRDPATARTVPPWRTSSFLDAVLRLIFRVVLLFSVVLLLGGHDKPGGGFIGGLVAGCAFMLVFLAGGERSLRQQEPLVAEVFLGLGVSATVLAGAIGWIGGGEFLESGALSGELLGIGEVELSTPLLFEVGVYLVVVGLVIALLRSLGREEVQEL